MKYIAITQQTSEWVLGKPNLRSALHVLISDANQLKQLKDAELSEGALRIAGSLDEKVLAIWNIDYLTNTGEEEWGFIRLQSPNGLSDHFEIGCEVFERCLYVINQRLQGLIVDPSYYPKHYTVGSHSCISGRGSEARQLSIGYMEGDGGETGLRRRSIVCVGPSRIYEEVSNQAVRDAGSLKTLCVTADGIISPLRRRPLIDISLFPELKDELSPQWSLRDDGYAFVNARITKASERDALRSSEWDYDTWIEPNSCLSPAQRQILVSDAIERHPVRVMGPGGSGKTLLMLLASIRLLRKAKSIDVPLKLLFVAHNAQMMDRIKEKILVLGGNEFLLNQRTHLLITTLNSFGREYIGLPSTVIIDKDAEATKEFQLSEVKSALLVVLERVPSHDTHLIRQIRCDKTLFDIFARLIMAEISIGIKAHGLNSDRRRYVQSEKPLSRLHGILDEKDRAFVFDVYEQYHAIVFDHYGALDTDDIALELLARLRAPVRQLKRKVDGFDYVLIDEAQLYNENERRVFPLLTKGISPNVPIMLAIDEAQEPYGQSSAGLALLGFSEIEHRTLPENHRSTKEIVDLSFFILQRTTDLFGQDFPDYCAISQGIQEPRRKSATPIFVSEGDASPTFAKFILRRVRDLRKSLWQIAVVCHAEIYWEAISNELSLSNLPLLVLTQRGQYIAQNKPIVVLSKPEYIGGQEFDAVIAVGLEQGVYPPRIRDNDALAAALEQQALREMYLTFTRARQSIVVALSKNAVLNVPLQLASNAGLLLPG